MSRHTPGHHNPHQHPILSEINVTPFIDVMLVLLIIFLVTAPLMMSGVPLKLPKASAQAVASRHQPVVVSLDKDNHLFLADKPVTPDELNAALALLLRDDAEQIVYIRADQAVDYGQIMGLLSRLGAAGVSRLSLVAEGQPVPKAATP